MFNQRSIRILLIGVLPLGSIGAALSHGLAADPALIVVRGNIEKFTTTPDGLTDGAILDNETETVVQWPVGFQEKFKPPMQVGDRVRAVGRWSADDPESPRLVIMSLTNLRSKQTLENSSFAEPGPKAATAPRVPSERGQVATAPDASPAPVRTRLDRTIVVRGNIERFTLGPQGETIGAVLDSDSEFVLRWPGALQERFLGIIKLGDRVRATGRRVQGPTGDNMILVKSVTNLDSRESAEDPGYIDGPAPPQATPAAERSRDIDLEQRVRSLENQIAELRQAIDRLRSQK